MAVKNYNKSFDLKKLSDLVKSWFQVRGYEVQANSSEERFVIQARKSSFMRSALGASRAFTVIISATSNSTTIDMQSGEWVQNLAAVGVGTLLTGGISLVGSGIAASWTKKIEFDLQQYLEKEILHLEQNLTKEPLTGDTEKTKACPYCAEIIKKNAIICRYCNRSIGTQSTAQQVQQENHKSSNDLVRAARQGDLDAIASLINRHLNPRGATAKVSRYETCLRVLVEANKMPHKEDIVVFISNGITKLEIAEINTLQVFGRKAGDEKLGWSQSVNLTSYR